MVPHFATLYLLELVHGLNCNLMEVPLDYCGPYIVEQTFTDHVSLQHLDS
jgi:hypothetical protein